MFSKRLKTKFCDSIFKSDVMEVFDYLKNKTLRLSNFDYWIVLTIIWDVILIIHITLTYLLHTMNFVF